ncbi:MAG TPA: hypothetical protein VL137_07795 [Polyangiaceae bacterium]|nr:hypothetical protein [Polyangiaceae bacterium]
MNRNIKFTSSPVLLAALVGFGLSLSCSSDTASPMMAAGGTTAMGGTASGGTATGGMTTGGTPAVGGTATGGTTTGGTPAIGGMATGGTTTGGTGGAQAGSGGMATGGTASGGGGTGGMASGGGGAGGAASGGGGTGGSGGQTAASAGCTELCSGAVKGNVTVKSILEMCPMFNYFGGSEATCLSMCAANETTHWDMMCRLMHLETISSTNSINDATHCPHVNGAAPCADH